MPPVPALMAAWIWAAVLPLFEEVARGPWQLAQYVAYRAAPSGGGVGGGGDDETVMRDVPVRVVEPLVAVAVMVAVPAETPVTRPEPFTVATAVLLEDQVMVAPAKAAPV